MNVTLLAINAKYVHSSLAVWYLTNGVKKYAQKPHTIKVVEATINQKMDDIVAQVVAQKPDLLGISTYIWNIGMLPELLEAICRQLPDVKIVLGGPEASCNAEYWVKNGADYVLRGEGERSFPSLLDALFENDREGLRRISGLCFSEKAAFFENIEKNPCNGTEDGEYVSPYSEEYFQALSGRIAYMETSRGCPFSCAYCLSGSSTSGFPSGVRFFPMEEVKAQIDKLSQSGTRTIKFVDRTFNCHAERAYDIMEYIIGLETDCCFHFEVAGDLFDERTLALLQAAPPGRIQLEIGIQSFHIPTLEAVSRKTNLEKIEKDCQKLLSGKNIHIHVDLIAGLPFETLSVFQNSFDRAYAMGAHTLQLGFLKLIHGSRLRERAKEWGILYEETPPYEIIRNAWLSEKELDVIRCVENAIQHTYNKGRFLSVLRYAMAASGCGAMRFFQGLGEKVKNQAMPLEKYAEEIFHYCADFEKVDKNKLMDAMICDLLGMTKGKCMPPFLKKSGKLRKQVVLIADKQLGRRIDFDEAAVLSTGKGVYADSTIQDPVTGLYRLCFPNE